MRELPPDQRPYEKCLREGEESLTDGELLAVILRTGTRETGALGLANRVLGMTKTTAYPGLLGLHHLSYEELRSLSGIGEVKAIQLKCIGELSRRLAAAQARPALSFQNPASISDFYMERLRHEEQEVLCLMLLDNRNQLLREMKISRGTASATLITPREVLIQALKCRAMGLILVHNHPSGDPTPSQSDQEITERIRQAGEVVGIRLLDHIIIGDRQYYSFCEQGLISQNV